MDYVEDLALLPASCEVCGRQFRGKYKKQMCRRHYLSVHLRVEKYECDFCKTRFAHANQRIRHYKKCLKRAEFMLISESDTRRSVWIVGGQWLCDSKLDLGQNLRGCNIFRGAHGKPMQRSFAAGKQFMI